MADVKRRLQQVLKTVMKEENAVAFFNDPVDAEGLGIAQEYRKVVKVPMDLSKVAAQLEAGRYSDATAVLRDVALTWRNCRAFNMPGSDVYNACDQLEGAFDKQWRKAKLDKLTGGHVSASLAGEDAYRPPPAQPVSVFAHQVKGKVPKSLNMVSGGQAGRKNIQLAKGHIPAPNASALSSGHPLLRCLNVVEYVMRLPNAEAFNSPVDLRAFPDYRQHVQSPMDLRTIRERLVPGMTQGWGTISYKSVAEVLANARLVWSNCRAYNPPGDPIVGACKELEVIFEQAWQTAGFSLDPIGGLTQRGSLTPSLSNRHSQPVSPSVAYSPRSQGNLQHMHFSPSAGNMAQRKAFGGRAAMDPLSDGMSHPRPYPGGFTPQAQAAMQAADVVLEREAREEKAYRAKQQQQQQQQEQEEMYHTRRERKPSRKADSDPDFSLNDSDSEAGGGASQHSSDSAGSWQPRKKRSSGAPSSSSGGNARKGKAQSMSTAGQTHMQHAGSGRLGNGAMSHEQFMSEASQLGSSRALMSYTHQPQQQQQHGHLGLAQQHHAYAMAKKRAEATAAAQKETDEERAVLMHHAKLSQARMHAAQAQQRAELAIREMHNAQAVLKQVEGAHQARAQAKEQAEQQAAELRKEEWPPGAKLVSSEAAQQLTQQQQQQQEQQRQNPPSLPPEVNALAQSWFDWDSPAVQSSMDSATTNQKPQANPQPQVAS